MNFTNPATEINPTPSNPTLSQPGNQSTKRERSARNGADEPTLKGRGKKRNAPKPI